MFGRASQKLNLQSGTSSVLPNSNHDFEDMTVQKQKNHHVLKVVGCSCGVLWRFLTKFFVPDHDGDGSIMSKLTYNPNFNFLH